MKRPKSFYLTPRQALSMVLLRDSFGELGYYIFPLARRLRRHQKEFVAAHKNRPHEFFIVRLRRDGTISLQPSAYKKEPQKVACLVADLKLAGHRIFWREQITLRRKNLCPEQYLNLAAQKEYRRLFNKNPSYI